MHVILICESEKRAIGGPTQVGGGYEILFRSRNPSNTRPIASKPTDAGSGTAAAVVVTTHVPGSLNLPALFVLSEIPLVESVAKSKI